MADQSGSHHRDAGDYFPQATTISPVTSQEELPSPAGASRNITPRGLLFPSFGEAHKNITANFTSRSTSNPSKGSSLGDAVSLGGASEDIPLQNLDLPFGRDRAESMRIARFDVCAGTPSRGPKGRSLTDVGPSKVRTSTGIDSEKKRWGPGTLPSNEPTGALSDTPSDAAATTGSVSQGLSDNTVDHIFEQYSTIVHGDGEISELSDLQDRSPPTSNYAVQKDRPLRGPEAYHRDGAASRCGFRGSEYSVKSPGLERIATHKTPDDQHLIKDSVTPSEFPSISPPGHLPDERVVSHVDALKGSIRAHSSEGSFTTVSNSQCLLNGAFQDEDEDEGRLTDIDPPREGRDRRLFPMPLQVQNVKEEARQNSLLSAHDPSSGGVTTSSDDDPFRYDKHGYSVFLQPSKEREVSAALRCVSDLSPQSKGTVYSPDGSPVRYTTLVPPLPIQHLKPGSFGRVSKTIFTSKRTQKPFYDTSALRSEWAIGDSPYESNAQDIKIPVIPAQTDTVSYDERQHEPRTSVKEEVVTMEDLLRAADKDTKGLASDKDEWETVATSHAGIDSGGLSIGYRTAYNSHGIKETGSSVADVSDELSSFHGDQDPFGSREQILQHPPAEDGPHQFRLRHLKGSERPVFVPEPRLHRVNGFVQNSTRAFSNINASTSVPSTAASLGRKVSNPFRNRNGKKRYNDSWFSNYKFEKSSRFEFRDSATLDDFGEHLANARESRAYKQVEPGPQGSFKPTSYAPGGTIPPAAHIEEARDYASSDITGISDRPHKLPFALLSLPEAARRQAIRRASGKEDHTESGIAHMRRARSYTPSNMTDGGILMSSPQFMPALPRPTHHHRVPTALYTPTTPEYPGDFWGGNRSIMTEETGRRLFRPIRHPNQSIYPTSTINTTMTSIATVHQQRFYGPNLGAPHIYFSDTRQRVLGTDPDLRALAGFGDLESARAVRCARNRVGYEARQKRNLWFSIMVVLSFFPFIALLVERGVFDSALSWYTKGEVHELTFGQRKVIRGIIILELLAYPALIIIMVWRILASHA